MNRPNSPRKPSIASVFIPSSISQVYMGHDDNLMNDSLLGVSTHHQLSFSSMNPIGDDDINEHSHNDLDGSCNSFSTSSRFSDDNVPVTRCKKPSLLSRTAAPNKSVIDIIPNVPNDERLTTSPSGRTRRISFSTGILKSGKVSLGFMKKPKSSTPLSPECKLENVVDKRVNRGSVRMSLKSDEIQQQQLGMVSESSKTSTRPSVDNIDESTRSIQPYELSASFRNTGESNGDLSFSERNSNSKNSSVGSNNRLKGHGKTVMVSPDDVVVVVDDLYRNSRDMINNSESANLVVSELLPSSNVTVSLEALYQEQIQKETSTKIQPTVEKPPLTSSQHSIPRRNGQELLSENGFNSTSNASNSNNVAYSEDYSPMGSNRWGNSSSVSIDQSSSGMSLENLYHMHHSRRLNHNMENSNHELENGYGTNSIQPVEGNPSNNGFKMESHRSLNYIEETADRISLETLYRHNQQQGSHNQQQGSHNQQQGSHNQQQGSFFMGDSGSNDINHRNINTNRQPPGRIPTLSEELDLIEKAMLRRNYYLGSFMRTVSDSSRDVSHKSFNNNDSMNSANRPFGSHNVSLGNYDESMSSSLSSNNMFGSSSVSSGMDFNESVTEHRHSCASRSSGIYSNPSFHQGGAMHTDRRQQYSRMNPSRIDEEQVLSGNNYGGYVERQPVNDMSRGEQRVVHSSQLNDSFGNISYSRSSSIRADVNAVSPISGPRNNLSPQINFTHNVSRPSIMHYQDSDLSANAVEVGNNQARFNQRSDVNVSRGTDNSRRKMINITPHQRLPFVGSDETIESYFQGHVVETNCKACKTFLYCSNCVTMVLCPSCESVSDVIQLGNRMNRSVSRRAVLDELEESVAVGLTVDHITEIIQMRR